MFPKRGMVQLSGPELAQDDSHHPALSGFALTPEILELSPSVGDLSSSFAPEDWSSHALTFRPAEKLHWSPLKLVQPRLLPMWLLMVGLWDLTVFGAEGLCTMHTI